MDLFSLLKNNLSPSKKMLHAITTKDVSLLEEVLQSGFDVNSKLLTQGGYTALHLAVAPHNYERSVVEKLLEYNADPSLKNGFGSTPIDAATVGGSTEVVKLLLENDSSCTSVDNFWNTVLQINEYQLVLPKFLSVLLIATPNFTKYPKYVRETMFRFSTIAVFKQYYTCEKIMMILDHELRSLFAIKQTTENDNKKELNNWFDISKCNAPTLQECCRLIIRQTFDHNHNVIYGVKKLVLPNRLKQFILFSDVTDLCL